LEKRKGGKRKKERSPFWHFLHIIAICPLMTAARTAPRKDRQNKRMEEKESRPKPPRFPSKTEIDAPGLESVREKEKKEGRGKKRAQRARR